MKTIILVLMLVIGTNAVAQNHFYKRFGKSEYSLVARKGSKAQHFRLGAPVRIITSDAGGNKVLKGYITHFEPNQFTLEPFGNKATNEPRTISPDDIQQVRYLSRSGRRGALKALGIGAVYAGLMAVITRPSPYQFIVFLPAMSIGLFFVYYFPLTYICDIVFQKTKRGGWHFAIEQGK